MFEVVTNRRKLMNQSIHNAISIHNLTNGTQLKDNGVKTCYVIMHWFTIFLLDVKIIPKTICTGGRAMLKLGSQQVPWFFRIAATRNGVLEGRIHSIPDVT